MYTHAQIDFKFTKKGEPYAESNECRAKIRRECFGAVTSLYTLTLSGVGGLVQGYLMKSGIQRKVEACGVRRGAIRRLLRNTIFHERGGVC